MSSIDLVVLGMVLEKPQSAYDIQKDVEYHHLSRWTKISVPSIYKKVLQLKENGYLKSQTVKGNQFAEKTIYTITDRGKAYFAQLMERYATQPVSILFDFNVVIANLNKVNYDQALVFIEKLRTNISKSKDSNDDYASQYSEIPLVGRTIFEQQNALFQSLLKWLDHFESQFHAQMHHGD